MTEMHFDLSEPFPFLPPAWKPAFGVLHGMSDALLALAFFLIPIAIFRFIRLRPDLGRGTHRVANLLIAFTVGCGITKVIALASLWWPLQIIEGVASTLTALVAIAAAILIWPMMPKLLSLPSHRQLQAVNAELHLLNEELNTIVAMRTAEVEDANRRLSLALKGANVTAFTQNKNLEYTWVQNPKVRATEAEILGLTDDQLMPEDVAEITRPLKKEVLATGESRSTFLALPTEEFGTVYLHLVVHALRNSENEITGLLGTATDITEKNLYEIRLAALTSQLATANKRFETAIRESLITVFEQDAELTYNYIANPPAESSQEDYIGRTDEEVWSLEDRFSIIPLKKQVLETGEACSAEVDVVIGGQQKSYDLSLEPILDADKRVTGLIGTAVDLTHKREQENHMRLIMRELSHRSKNLLAVIQAMASQTAASARSKDEFFESFSARLQAMAASHDLLVNHSWYGATLEELVRTQVSQQLAPGGDQLVVSGPPVELNNEAVQNMGLALHELVTNAAKYGALSVPDGRVEVRWEAVEDGVRFIWQERDGPVVSQPQHKGFGTTLLEKVVGPALGAETTLSYDAEGLRCSFTIAPAMLRRGGSNATP
ncbi:sensor histidine kinase [Pseudovibrio exalbescens]|uniref:Blue-light-activated histidine kinase n=1 Tax=Pseudovibrio exalbescens TaxID=197461 RepID=A0A1U7JK52_9HYPH|nr:HWE histidine kinase domain-containing protein [Pseudovibrio exalbescens]OKL45130.1 hypothetical protein A3843_05090 [Pseudovibrio exalbescens]